MTHDSSDSSPASSLNQSKPRAGRKDRRARTPDTFSIIVLDIDHFGQYSDTHGDQAGSTLLQAVADILQTATRGADVPERLERDVFSVLLPQTSAQGALVAAERLRASIAAHQGKQHVSVSVGVATMKPTNRSTEQVMQEAEQALVWAKQRGRNCVVHFDLSSEGSGESGSL